jgi:hypothetical protein
VSPYQQAGSNPSENSFERAVPSQQRCKRRRSPASTSNAVAPVTAAPGSGIGWAPDDAKPPPHALTTPHTPLDCVPFDAFSQ